MHTSTLAARILATLSALNVSLASAAGDGTAIFEAVRGAVVTIRATGNSDRSKSGSAILIRRDELLTNCHVVEGASSVDATFSDGQTSSATVVGRFGALDLCLLQVPSAARRPVRISPVSNARPGQRVFAIGAPLGLKMTISEGIISGLRNNEGSTFVQTTAPVSPGSSGGGLFDEKGGLLAITTSTYTAGQNVNFAIPAEYAVAETLRALATAALSSSPDISFKGLPFGVSQSQFQAAFPGATCSSLDAATVTCEGNTEVFDRKAEFTAFFKETGMNTVVVRIYTEDMDSTFAAAMASLTDRFKTTGQAKSASLFSWDVGGKKEQAIFLAKCDGSTNCKQSERLGVMVIMSDFRVQPKKRKDF